MDFCSNKIMLYLLLLLSTSLCACDAYRFLVVFPMPSKSHSLLGQGVCNHLVDAGHEVVYVTSFARDPKSLPENLKELNVSSILQQIMALNGKSIAPRQIHELVGKRSNFADSADFFLMVSDFTKFLLENQVFVDFVTDPNQKFDAVINEWFFSELWAGLAPLFRCPLIWVGSTEAHWMNLRLVDEVMNPAHSVDLFSVNSLPLTFTQRAEELYNIVKRMLILQFQVLPKEREAYKSAYAPLASKRGVTMPSYDEAAYNASLILLNSHPSMGIPYRFPQNAKHIGGYHLNKNIEPLPKDLQEIMDGAMHGVIYFSMGSNLQSKDMSDKMKRDLLNMFGQFEQVVLWKFEVTMDFNIPKNVHLLEWAPQQSILAHPNLKLFITHGGQLSTTEAIHYGKPLVGVPVFGDQFVNMQLAVQKGFAVKVNLEDNLHELLRPAIEEVLSNPSYNSNAKKLSSIYHDRLVSPGAELVHWVEHVVRTGGALHLRSPALMVPWYQKIYLDLLAVILAVFIILCAIVKKIFKKLIKKNSNKFKLN